MSLTGYIKNLFVDKEKTIPLFPKTKVRAVSDDDGVGLNVILEDIRRDIAYMSGSGSGNIDVSDGAGFLKKLFAAGSTVLSSHQYGKELPENAQNGQVFFQEATGTIADIGQDVAKAVRAVNLLDNSDFRNPINQRGYYSGATVNAWQYFIDRWIVEESATTIDLQSDGMKFSKTIIQVLEKNHMGETLTFAAKINGIIYCCSGIVPSTNAWTQVSHTSTDCGGISFFIDNSQKLCVNISNSTKGTVEWCALYEGEYTVETLPPYVPKGYAAELLECRRYFRRVATWETFAYGYIDWDGSLVAIMPVEQIMRISPSVSGLWDLTVIANGQYIVITTAPSSVFNHSYGSIEMRWAAGTVVSTHYNRVCGFKTNDGNFTLSADL